MPITWLREPLGAIICGDPNGDGLKANATASARGAARVDDDLAAALWVGPL